MVKAPFMDRFKAPEARQNSARGRDAVADVARNLASVLNTKEGFGYFLPGFGLGDWTAKRGTPDLVETLTEEIENAIDKHEPRIKSPELVMLGRDAGLWLHFNLKCVINGQPARLRIRFETVTAQVTVEEKE